MGGITLKKTLSLTEWVKKYQFDNFLAIVLENIILVGLYFLILRGDAHTNENAFFIQIFIIMFIPKACVQIPLVGLIKSRTAFIRGLWQLKENEAKSIEGKLQNPWRYLGPRAFVISLCVAIPVSFTALILNNRGTLSATLTGIMCFIITLIISSYFVKNYYFKDLTLFARQIKIGAKIPTSNSKYILWEYLLPWSILIFLSSFIINIKSYTEKSLNIFNNVAVILMISDIFLTAGVIIYWMWDTGQNQVRPSIALGKVSRIKPLDTEILFLKFGIYFFLLPTLILGLGMGFLLLFLDYFRLTILEATLTTTLVATFSGIIGCFVGIWFGKHREFLLIKIGP